MARDSRGLGTTRHQLFNDETTKNENKFRNQWYEENRERLLTNLQDEKLIRKAQTIREDRELERLKRKKEEDDKIEEVKPLPAWRPQKPDGSVNLDVMKPVDPSIREILYEPGESSYITANKYLRQRCKDKPEDRYYFPDCTYWLHGWRLGDYPPVPSTKVGRRSLIRAWFYRRNGVSMKRDDPKRSPQSTNPKNFNDLLTY